jgi:hypothetical protein
MDRSIWLQDHEGDGEAPAAAGWRGHPTTRVNRIGGRIREREDSPASRRLQKKESRWRGYQLVIDPATACHAQARCRCKGGGIRSVHIWLVLHYVLHMSTVNCSILQHACILYGWVPLQLRQNRGTGSGCDAD